MWIYFLNVLLIPLYSRFFKNRKAFVIIVGLQLFLILALRSNNLGVDLANYSGGYDFIKGLSFDDLWSRLNGFGVASLEYPFNYESGYALFNWIISHLGLSFHGFLVICAAINIVSISWFIYRYSKKPWLSFIIFSTFGFFVYDFGIIRQSLALSMFLLSYIMLDKKKAFLSILSFIIAFGFHRTVIITLPLLFIMKMRNISRKRFSILLLFAVPVLLMSSVLYNGIIVGLMSFLGKNYVGHGMVVNKMFFLLIAISLLVVFFYDFSKIKEKIDSVTCYVLLFALYFSILGLYNDVLSRALEYFSIFLIIMIPAIIDQCNNQKGKLLIEIIIYLLFVGFMFFNIRGSILDPYVFNNGGFLW